MICSPETIFDYPYRVHPGKPHPVGCNLRCTPLRQNKDQINYSLNIYTYLHIYLQIYLFTHYKQASFSLWSEPLFHCHRLFRLHQNACRHKLVYFIRKARSVLAILAFKPGLLVLGCRGNIVTKGTNNYSSFFRI